MRWENPWRLKTRIVDTCVNPQTKVAKLWINHGMNWILTSQKFLFEFHVPMINLNGNYKVLVKLYIVDKEFWETTYFYFHFFSFHLYYILIQSLDKKWKRISYCIFMDDK